MAYFNHAFCKTFLCTGNAATTGKTSALAFNSGTGAADYGFYNPKTWTALPLNTTFNGDCCPLVFANAGFLTSDKIGPFHGGYQESNKSKTINPRYVSRVYEVLACPPQQMQVLVGETTDSFETASCSKTFNCGETYYLRLDLKGSPVLQFLTRNAYWEADAYGGCCADPSNPAPVADNLVIYSQWAYHFMNNTLLSPFIDIKLTYSTDNGVTWDELTPGANLETWRTYVDNPIAGVTNAGMIITGAYVDTRFGDCTFYPSDSTIAFMEPVRIYASEVDLNGDPCTFSGLCIVNQCEPIQQTGTGEHVLRSLILSESYRQNWFATNADMRIREITQGFDFTNVISRSARYRRLYIQHNVPRFNNPSSTFDNDQYLLELVFPDTVAGGNALTEMKTFLNNWLACAGGTCTQVETIACPAVCTQTPAVVA